MNVYIFLRTENCWGMHWKRKHCKDIFMTTDSRENYSECFDDTSWKPWDIQDNHHLMICKPGSVWEQP